MTLGRGILGQHEGQYRERGNHRSDDDPGHQPKSVAGPDVLDVQIGGTRVFVLPHCQPAFGGVDLCTEQQQTAVAVFIDPLLGPDQKPGVLTDVNRVVVHRLQQPGECRLKIVDLVAEHHPVVRRDRGMHARLVIILDYLAVQDRYQPLVVRIGVVHFLVADIRANRIGTDDEGEGIGRFDACLNFAHPVDGEWNIFPVHPDIPAEIRQLVVQPPHKFAVFTRIGNENVGHWRPRHKYAEIVLPFRILSYTQADD